MRMFGYFGQFNQNYNTIDYGLLQIYQKKAFESVLHYLFSFVKINSKKENNEISFLESWTEYLSYLRILIMINKDVLEIFRESVSAVLPENAIKNSLSVSKSRLSIQGKTYNLKKYNNIYLFGVGKASIKMAKELEKLLGSFLKGGFVVGTKVDNLKRIKTYISDHPVLSQRSIKAGKELKKEMGVIINRFGIGDANVEKYCEEHDIPIIAEIPNMRKIAEIYSEGNLIYSRIPEVRTQLENIISFISNYQQENIL